MGKVKKAVLALAMVVLAVFVLHPVSGEAASSLQQINKELKNVRDQMNQAKHDASDAEKKSEEIVVQKQAAAEDIKKIMAEVNQVGEEMNKVQQEVKKTEKKLLQTGQELEDAQKRIESRDQVMQDRIRLMYTNGFVSYMDVLLSANSFSDFLDRFDSLQSILNQDHEILEQHRKDKETVVQKQAEVTSQLTDVKKMYKKLQQSQDALEAKEKQKEAMIASYDKEMEELEEISEEQEQLLVDLAKKVSKLEREKNRFKNYYTGGGKLGIPIKGKYRVSSSFGMRTNPVSGKYKLHAGMDFAAPQGTTIVAAEAGVVLVSGWNSGYGNVVIIDHGNGMWTLYGHIRNGGLEVSEGETVKRGQKIAEVGSTGNSTGPHLHFEVRKNETPVNPSGYLK
ncbi:murein hydrolase activator EnvC family protein [Paenibacillus sp. GCM10023252]|uniref:murein hydrolase activator EnvC family protein n=1 Tax=Paenibacillus sp. GCM10023252 TaxID=3252649 RepID=UPI0036223994